MLSTAVATSGTATPNLRGLHVLVTRAEYDCIVVLAGPDGTMSEVVRAAIRHYLAERSIADKPRGIDTEATRR